MWTLVLFILIGGEYSVDRVPGFATREECLSAGSTRLRTAAYDYFNQDAEISFKCDEAPK